jgi:hypothetical protein
MFNSLNDRSALVKMPAEDVGDLADSSADLRTSV